MDKKKLFYFDIETVGQYKDLESLKENDKRGYDLFVKKYNKAASFHSDHTLEEAYLRHAPIFSTFGKVVCVSFGYYTDKNINGYTTKSIYNDDEYELMKEVQSLFMAVSKKQMFISGYNINIFDIPWLVQKMNKYGLTIPNVLRIYGKKPWEMQTFDLCKEWKSFNNTFSSFDEVCYTLDIPSPKDVIDGSQVHSSYWNNNDLETIKTYCEGDVKSSMDVAEKMLFGHL